MQQSYQGINFVYVYYLVFLICFEGVVDYYFTYLVCNVVA